ncbi:hypothetical protein PAHAL_2G209300 [Panicum hallii]|uniref:Uncharacterized protein n=1 Tax=Panicum hallii TaxID=206008 RepID=A0A2T8KPV3_9POAL|nr:hypothetical protein PAHAL_2G209300 [Panicum hallii]
MDQGALPGNAQYSFVLEVVRYESRGRLPHYYSLTIKCWPLRFKKNCLPPSPAIGHYDQFLPSFRKLQAQGNFQSSKLEERRAGQQIRSHRLG